MTLDSRRLLIRNSFIVLLKLIVFHNTLMQRSLVLPLRFQTKYINSRLFADIYNDYFYQQYGSSSDEKDDIKTVSRGVKRVHWDPNLDY